METAYIGDKNFTFKNQSSIIDTKQEQNYQI